MRKRDWFAMVLVLVIAGCSSRQPRQLPPPRPYHPEEASVRTIQTEPVPIARQMEGQSGIVQVLVSDMGFEPAILTARVGDRVKIHLQNKGTKEHTLTLPRWGVFIQNLLPGGETYIEFTASEKGVWRFFSDAPGEPEPGLTGELRVE